MSVRVARNAGSFYPKSKREIEYLIDIFNKGLDKENSFLYLEAKSIISPHAGYIYSGFWANFAHRVLANRKPRRVVVIGPSHHVYFKGVSASFFEQYQTPIKNLKIDLDYLGVMRKEFNLQFVQNAHNLEHSTETQMPFIAHYQPDVKVIELIYGDVDYKELAKIVTWLLEDSLTSVVISSDLSHFHSQERANLLDGICIDGVVKLDNDIIDLGCEACGIKGIKAIIDASNTLNLESKILDYRTSADAINDTSSVVGYLSAAFVES